MPRGGTMKKADADVMRKRYDFSRGERGKYARRYREGTRVVVIDSDVQSAEADGIGARVRALREESGLTGTRLAEKVGICGAQISRLENGRQGFRSGTLVRIAKALKVPPFRLLMTDREWARWKKK